MVVSIQDTRKIGCYTTIKVKEFHRVYNAKECSQQTQDEVLGTDHQLPGPEHYYMSLNDCYNV